MGKRRRARVGNGGYLWFVIFLFAIGWVRVLGLWLDERLGWPLMILAAGLVIAAFVWRKRRQTKQFDRAIERQRQGDLDGAAAILEKLDGHARGTLGQRVSLEFAIIEMQRGHNAAALGHLRDADEASISDGDTSLRVARELAFTYALMGQTEAAEAWLTELKRRTKTAPEGYAIFAETVLALRRGEGAAAADRLAAGWSGLEALFTGAELRRLHLLWALAERQRGDEVRAMAHIKAAGARGDTGLGEHGWMAASWPALAEMVRGGGAAAPV